MRFTLRLNEELDRLISKKAKALGISKNSLIVSLLWEVVKTDIVKIDSKKELK